jgi:hypothetical protein
MRRVLYCRIIIRYVCAVTFRLFRWGVVGVSLPREIFQGRGRSNIRHNECVVNFRYAV